MIGVFSAIAGFLFVAALLVLRNLGRNTVNSPRDLALITGVQNVGSLPTLPGGRRRGMPNLVLERGDSDIAETLRALARGVSVPALALEWYVSEATVRTHVRSILTKLGVSSQLAAVAAALRTGWLDLVPSG